MTIDIDRIRAETPGVAERLHFNNAGAALMPQPVVDAQLDHIRLEAQIGGYEAAAARHDRLEGVYDSVARLIGAHRDEIAIVENATVAWDMAFYSLMFSPGDRILTAQAEYAANYVAYLQTAKRTGAVIDVIPSTEDGEVCCESLSAMIDDRVKLIAITQIPTNGGLVNPAAEIGAIAKANGIPYLLDACQAVGQMPIDVTAIGCDMLSATGRKYLRGPRGSGFLYVNRELLPELEPPMIDLYAAEWVAPDRYELRSDARRFENWENNYAARLGLGAAVDYAMDRGLAETWPRIVSLSGLLRQRLSELPRVSVTDIGKTKCGIVTFTVDDIASVDVKARLAAESINVSVSKPSSTLLDAESRRLPPLVRASVHYYNTEDEVHRFASVLGTIVSGPAA